MNFPWDESITLLFKDTSHLAPPFPHEPHVSARGKFQLVLTREEHPFVTMFSQYCKQVAGEAESVIGIPLHLCIAALANVCARPIDGDLMLKLGQDTLHPVAMDSRLRIAVEQCGLPVVPYTLSSFREACELHLSNKGALLAVDLHCFFNPNQAAQRCSDYWEFPLCSMETRSPLLTAYSEISEYCGPSYLEYDNERGSPAADFMEYMISTCIDAAKQNDHSINRMPIKIVLSRIHRMLEECRWDSTIAKAIECTDDAIVDVADRIVLWTGGDLRACSRTLENRIDTWLKSTSAAVVVEFLGTSVSQNTSGDIAKELARLLPSASATLTRRRELETDRAAFYSVADFKNLVTFLASTEVKSVWSFPTTLAMPLKQKVDAILKDQEDTHESHTASNGSEHTTSPSQKNVNPVAFTNDMNKLLQAQFRTPEYRKLEEQLTNYSRELPVLGLTEHQKRLSKANGIPNYYLPLTLIFASNGAEIVKRFILQNNMRVLKPDIFRYLDELRDHWVAYANLRCIWDESSPLLPEMLTFKSVGSSIADVRRGRLSVLQVMKDLHMAERTQVRYSHAPYEYKREDLADPNKTAKDIYAQYMDRILSTIGYKCAHLDPDGRNDSHMAIMMGIKGFCEKADPLSEERSMKMREYAKDMLDKAELEAEERFRAFLGSKNPASVFPSPYLANDSPIKTMLLKKNEQLDSILSLQGFDDSILQGDTVMQPVTLNLSHHISKTLHYSGNTHTCSQSRHIAVTSHTSEQTDKAIALLQKAVTGPALSLDTTVLPKQHISPATALAGDGSGNDESRWV